MFLPFLIYICVFVYLYHYSYVCTIFFSLLDLLNLFYFTLCVMTLYIYMYTLLCILPLHIFIQCYTTTTLTPTFGITCLIPYFIFTLLRHYILFFNITFTCHQFNMYTYCTQLHLCILNAFLWKNKFSDLKKTRQTSNVLLFDGREFQETQ